MYNEALKEKFIQQRNKSINDQMQCRCIFERIERFEEAWGADICTRSSKELKPVLELVCNAQSEWSRLYILKAYCKWCLNDIDYPDACDGIFHVKLSGFEETKRKMVANPLDLQRCLNAIFKPESDHTIDNIYRCFFWLAFSGIPEEEALDITVDEVNLIDMTIIHNGVEYELYRESFKSIRICTTSDWFSRQHPLYHAIIKKPRGDSNQLLRGFGDRISTQAIRTAVSLALRNTESKRAISYNRVWLSGVFYRIHEDEVITGVPRFDGFLDDFMRGKEYKLGPGRSSAKTVRKEKLNLITKRYERWKVAFNY